ncbi:unnamed protein product [Candidula unifasciata]|uniref:G-protein coupled receptors family 1 profile domain-containing protein n=1 Tax=Candidula unifasciata TaxID=100452 RepID=A0A8S3YXD9_9EUPU|nr:unnamed protein product [Candidula unifasciata]
MLVHISRLQRVLLPPTFFLRVRVDACLFIKQFFVWQVQQNYKKAHAYLSLVICTYGVITNIINIVVLTKPKMRNSINCILTGVAVADTITMTSYIPFAYFYYLMNPDTRIVSLPWNTFLAVHMNLTLISHTSSIWLGVIMAAMRYFFVRPTTRGAQTLDCRSTLPVILITFLGAVLLIIPNCLATGLEPCYNNATGLVNWHLSLPSFGQGGNTLHTITFFIYPVAGKIVPCTLISIFGGLLLHTLRETDKRSRRLKGESSSGNNGHSQTRRTTIMLLAIIALYLISEIPQSILVLLCIFVQDFFTDVYGLLGDFIDLLTLLNTAFNFITYIAMSSQFRNTLVEVSLAWANTLLCQTWSSNSVSSSPKSPKSKPTAV